jgi:hypothetical protein
MPGLCEPPTEALSYSHQSSRITSRARLSGVLDLEELHLSTKRWIRLPNRRRRGSFGGVADQLAVHVDRRADVNTPAGC